MGYRNFRQLEGKNQTNMNVDVIAVNVPNTKTNIDIFIIIHKSKQKNASWNLLRRVEIEMQKTNRLFCIRSQQRIYFQHWCTASICLLHLEYVVKIKMYKNRHTDYFVSEICKELFPTLVTCQYLFAAFSCPPFLQHNH